MGCSIHISFWFELGAAIIASVFWRSLGNSALRWFIPFLWMIVLVEGSSHLLRCAYSQPNAWLFNFSVPIEYLFYLLIFRMITKNELYKKIALLFIILLSAYAIYSILFITRLSFFNMKILAIGSFSMVLFSILHFIELYNQDSEESTLKNPYFWIFTGVFLFNIGEFCYNLLASFLTVEGVDKTLKIFRQINSNLVLVLYSCFIIGFICKRITGKYKTG